MEPQRIIMNFSLPPALEDLEVMTRDILENMPDELASYCEDVEILIEELPDEATEQELELDDPFEVLALFRKGSEISPGVERKVAANDDCLILYRRPLLDYWCECCDDLSQILRQVIIEEIARNYEFADDDIDDMVQRHYQGMF